MFSRRPYALKQHPLYGVVAPKARNGKCRNQRMEMEVPALLISLSDLPAKFLFCAPVPLFSAGPEVLILKRRVLHKKTATMIPLNSQLRLPLVHFEFLVLLNQQKKKKLSYHTAWDNWSSLPRQNWTAMTLSKQEYVWNTRDPLGCILVRSVENKTTPFKQDL